LPFFYRVNSVFQYRYSAYLFIDFIIGVALQPRCKFSELRIPTRYVTLGWSGDNQRGAGFVNENRVDLVHDGETVTALHHVIFRHDHVVAQVVEAKLVVGPVGNISIVLCFALGGWEPGGNHTGFHAEEPEDTAHEFR